jgi:hypothetical protein
MSYFDSIVEELFKAQDAADAACDVSQNAFVAFSEAVDDFERETARNAYEKAYPICIEAKKNFYNVEQKFTEIVKKIQK